MLERDLELVKIEFPHTVNECMHTLSGLVLANISIKTHQIAGAPVEVGVTMRIISISSISAIQMVGSQRACCAGTIAASDFVCSAPRILLQISIFANSGETIV